MSCALKACITLHLFWHWSNTFTGACLWNRCLKVSSVLSVCRLHFSCGSTSKTEDVCLRSQSFSWSLIYYGLKRLFNNIHKLKPVVLLVSDSQSVKQSLVGYGVQPKVKGHKLGASLLTLSNLMTCKQIVICFDWSCHVGVGFVSIRFKQVEKTAFAGYVLMQSDWFELV